MLTQPSYLMTSNSPITERDNLVPVAILSLVVGAAAGFIGALFRLALDQADFFRNALIRWSHGFPVVGLGVIVAACAAATGIAAWLVRRFAPHASGSGIPHTEAVLEGAVPPPGTGLIPVKFVGGVLSIGSGLALGREGPTVQVGASIGYFIGKTMRRPWTDCRVLMAAGAGAGLATAFNAPIAGAIFVLEELVRRFETQIAIAALGASATAMVVARIFLGDVPELKMTPLSYPSALANVDFVALGIVAGFVAVAYNRAILSSLGLIDGFKRRPIEMRAAIIGGLVGIVAWFAPQLVGGGEALAQHSIDGAFLPGVLGFVFLLRFVLGPVSYAAATPGGLFAPLLALGAQIGLLCYAVVHYFQLDFGASSTAFAVVGMAAFFTGVVRAPVTGIVLITEMTASFSMLLPMLGACFAAMLIPTLLNCPPIYTSLSLLDSRTETVEVATEEKVG
ncbi:MAG TPA: H(+)/Cl(-) exchange transporter ClcA [Lacipirellulaceae bacterium]|jgi:CIC family chloride channel protein|nr:H(+)/Cl(-) exchange transporter ClcA [Lacipirellulaceae bacterium]